MIILGSYAAQLRGDLPEWAAQANDFDLCGSVAEFEDLDRHLETDLPKVVIDLSKGSCRKAIRIQVNKTDRILIDYVTTEKPSSVLLHKIEDHQPASVFGLPCLMVSAQTELVSKLAYADFDIWREKNDRWIDHWQSVVGDIQWTPELRAFYDQLHAEYAAQRETT